MNCILIHFLSLDTIIGTIPPSSSNRIFLMLFAFLQELCFMSKAEGDKLKLKGGAFAVAAAAAAAGRVSRKAGRRTWS